MSVSIKPAVSRVALITTGPNDGSTVLNRRQTHAQWGIVRLAPIHIQVKLQKEACCTLLSIDYCIRCSGDITSLCSAARTFPLRYVSVLQRYCSEQHRTQRLRENPSQIDFQAALLLRLRVAVYFIIPFTASLRVVTKRLLCSNQCYERFAFLRLQIASFST